MKIQCNACGAAEARVLCCADEAALCAACDEEVHAANKLAGKHQRVPLLSDADADASAPAPAVPKCDICQVSAVLRSCSSRWGFHSFLLLGWVGGLELPRGS
jgi:hypothetical protein